MISKEKDTRGEKMKQGNIRRVNKELQGDKREQKMKSKG